MVLTLILFFVSAVIKYPWLCYSIELPTVFYTIKVVTYNNIHLMFSLCVLLRPGCLFLYLLPLLWLSSYQLDTTRRLSRTRRNSRCCLSRLQKQVSFVSLNCKQCGHICLAPHQLQGGEEESGAFYTKFTHEECARHVDVQPACENSCKMASVALEGAFKHLRKESGWSHLGCFGLALKTKYSRAPQTCSMLFGREENYNFNMTVA